MKTKKILLTASCILSVCALAACGNSNGTQTTDSNNENVDEILKGFKTELGSENVKGTFKNKYKVEVDAHGGTSDFSSFRHDIDSVLDFEFSLGDNFYFYSKKTWEDKDDANSKSVTEAILYREDGKYMYSTTYTSPVEVTNAKEKLNEILSEVSAEQAGGLSLSSFIYSKGQYELDTFGLTPTFTLDEIKESSYKVTGSKGLEVTYNPDYIGYQTDNGMSDFGIAEGKNTAADVSISVNEYGYVTAFNENIHAALDFAIMTPKPTVSINGTRELQVTYNASISEKNDSNIEHKNPVSKVTLGNTENGSYTVSWFDYDNNSYAMTPVNSSDRVEVGMWLAIKPEANEGYEIDNVTVNGNETEIVVNGMYCFKIGKEAQKVSVVFKEKGGDTPVVPELLGSYEGASSNGTVMDVNIYKDGTFTVTCPGFGNARAGDGTYTKDGLILTLTSTNMQYFTVVNTTIEMTMASDFQSLTTSSFFNGEEITFTLKK